MYSLRHIDSYPPRKKPEHLIYTNTVAVFTLRKEWDKNLYVLEDSFIRSYECIH